MQARALAAINSNKIRIAAVALVEVPVQVAVQAGVVHHAVNKEIGERRISFSGPGLRPVRSSGTRVNGSTDRGPCARIRLAPSPAGQHRQSNAGLYPGHHAELPADRKPLPRHQPEQRPRPSSWQRLAAFPAARCLEGPII
jgi:hypothetical protein